MSARLPAPGVVDVWCVVVQRSAVGGQHLRRMLRSVLAEALGTSPAGLRLAYGAHGKPYVVGARLHFNLSHARSLGLIALSRDGEVGVDVQDVPSAAAAARVARRWFAPAEAHRLNRAPAAERPRIFADLWAAKEAYLKLTGEGLTRRMDSFVVDFDFKGDPVLDSHPSVTLRRLEVGGAAAAILATNSALRLGSVHRYHADAAP